MIVGTSASDLMKTCNAPICLVVYFFLLLLLLLLFKPLSELSVK